MPQLRTLLVGLAAILVAGCSTASEPEAAAPQASGPETVAASGAQTEQLPSEPLGDLVAIVERTMATPHRYNMFLELPDGNQDIDPMKPIQSGAFDGTLLAVDTFMGLIQPEASSDPVMQAITGDGIGYFALPGLRMLDTETRNQMLASNPLAPAIDSWVVVDLAQVRDRTGIDELTFTPNMADVAGDLTEVLTAVVDVQEGPASSIRGVATRTFTGTVLADPDDLFQPDDVSVSFHIDGQGYLRSATTDSNFGRSRIEIFDIGSAVMVELPDSVIDITESSIDSLGPQQASVPAATPTPIASDPNVVRVPSLLDLVALQPELSIFLSLLVESGLDAAIDDSADTPTTVLAPTNSALEQMGDELVRIRNDESLLAEFVSVHMLYGSNTLAELRAIAASGPIGMGTISGPDGLGWVVGVAVDSDGRLVLGAAAQVLVGDVTAINGVMHIIDRPVR